MVSKMAEMQTSAKGEALIRKWEGFYSKPYYDSVGVLTIGYGTIENEKLGIHIEPGMKISETKAIELMRIELRAMEHQVNDMLKADVTQDEFDAMMSFAYNLGTGALSRSTLLKRVNAGQLDLADDEFGKWVYATDRRTGQRYKLKGLVNRRADEARMFRGDPVEDLDVRTVPTGAKVSRGQVQHEDEMRVDPPSAGWGAAPIGGALVAIQGQIQEHPAIALAVGAIIAAAGVGAFWYFFFRKGARPLDPTIQEV